MLETLLRESRKFPNVILVDFGTLFAKCSIMVNGEVSDDIIVVRNELYLLSEERCKYLEQLLSGPLQVEPGYYTYKEIAEKALLFQVEEKYVQSDAIPHSVDLLAKSYQNISEYIEEHFELPFNIIKNYHNWAIVIGVAAFETAEARATVEEFHIKACISLGFAGVYINNQLLFDYFSQLNYLKNIGTLEGYCTLVNIGGGDTEVAVVSGLPQASTYRRFPIAGQYVFRYIHNALREKYRLTGVVGEQIENWLAEGGTVLGDAPVTIKKWKRMDINIQEFLNCPGMLFDWNYYWGVERIHNSVTDVIIASIDSLITQTEADIGLILSAIVLVGGAARFKGITSRIEKDLKEYYSELADRINVILGEEPQHSGINGIRALIKLKYKDEGLMYTILPRNDEIEGSIDWQSDDVHTYFDVDEQK
ncbi:MAG: rod shape-determining protein [Candidatus Kariarchaeaceae archaeon]